MKNTLKKIGKVSWRFIKRNLPTILTAVGIAGTVGAGVLYSRGRDDYNDYLDEAYEEGPVTRNDKFKAFIDAYALPICVHSASIALILMGDRMHVTRQIKLSEAYMALDASYKAYRLKSNELYGDDAEARIDHEIMKDRMKTNMDWQLGTDKVTFYDSWGDRYFEATMEEVDEAIAAVNNHFCRYGYAYLNSFYACIPGLDSIPYARDVGWTGVNVSDYIHFDVKHVVIYDNEIYDYFPESGGFECYYISTTVDPEFIDLFYAK